MHTRLHQCHAGTHARLFVNLQHAIEANADTAEKRTRCSRSRRHAQGAVVKIKKGGGNGKPFGAAHCFSVQRKLYFHDVGFAPADRIGTGRGAGIFLDFRVLILPGILPD